MTTCLSNGLRVRAPRSDHDTGSVLLVRDKHIYECVEYAQAVRRKLTDADWRRLCLDDDLLERLRAANAVAALPLTTAEEKHWMRRCVPTQGAIMHLAAANKAAVKLLSSTEKEPPLRGGGIVLRLHFELPSEPCYGFPCVDYVTARLLFERVDAAVASAKQ